ncbi:uncharacterized protein LOC113214001 [Frankliniella occidentalis]|uniref:Uncharacterized protein LOC113214001 n=1 Tax=Frankliniella occidentalis TaxID=133901 RepID=A0A6J1T6Y1_FRAOC|nr:uncharacterized protein LOC113214001 [Frankliniella occidentalis]
MRCLLLAIAVCLRATTGQAAAVAQRDLLVVDRFGNCDNSERIAPLISAEVVTLKPGITVVRASANISKEVDQNLLEVETFICDIQAHDSCVQFLNWKKDTGVCAMATAKGMLWSPLFNVRPPLRCPVIAKGLYHIENGTFDMNKMQMISLPKNKYVRIKISTFAPKKIPYLCVIMGGIFRSVKV